MTDANLLLDDESTAYPASAATPGQAESRNAHAAFEEMVKDAAVWLDDYYRLRGEGWDWRKAAYIAWASSPATDRWPKTQMELATKVLGLRSDRTIQKWRADDARIDERVAKMQIEPLMRHRRDVIEALVAVASSHDPKAASDRRVFLEMTGDYKPKSTVQMQSWQDEVVALLKEGQLTAQEVIDELGLDDARQLLIAAGAPVPASAFEGAEERQVTLPYFKDKYMTGFDYAREYALPNFFFHVTIAYGLMRKAGVPLGKADFMHGLPLRDSGS